MELFKYIEQLGIAEFYERIIGIFSLTEIVVLMILLVLLLILFSIMAIRKRSIQLLNLDRKILYELNQLNANIPGLTRPGPAGPDRTDPMF
jgi:undecaprenyl pyrophosphate phosphatase UppP